MRHAGTLAHHDLLLTRATLPIQLLAATLRPPAAAEMEAMQAAVSEATQLQQQLEPWLPRVCLHRLQTLRREAATAVRRVCRGPETGTIKAFHLSSKSCAACLPASCLPAFPPVLAFDSWLAISPLPNEPLFSLATASCAAGVEHKRCSHCGATPPQLRVCYACGTAVYCDKECQQAAWPSHRKACKLAAAAKAMAKAT